MKHPQFLPDVQSTLMERARKSLSAVGFYIYSIVKFFDVVSSLSFSYGFMVVNTQSHDAPISCASPTKSSRHYALRSL